MFADKGEVNAKNSPISPALFPHFMEKEGAKHMQNIREWFV